MLSQWAISNISNLLRPSLLCSSILNTIYNSFVRHVVNGYSQLISWNGVIPIGNVSIQIFCDANVSFKNKQRGHNLKKGSI